MTRLYLPNTFQTPNALVDELLPELSDAELRLFLAIQRHTIGYHKLADRLSFSQLRGITGIKDNRTLRQAGDSLEKRGLITIDRSKHKHGWLYDIRPADAEDGATSPPGDAGEVVDSVHQPGGMGTPPSGGMSTPTETHAKHTRKTQHADNAAPVTQSADGEESSVDSSQVDAALDLLEEFGIRRQFARSKVQAAMQAGVNDFTAFYHYIRRYDQSAREPMICKHIGEQDWIQDFLAEQSKPSETECPICHTTQTAGEPCSYCGNPHAAKQDAFEWAADKQLTLMDYTPFTVFMELKRSGYWRHPAELEGESAERELVGAK
jgi:hypothetical protein